MSGVTTLIVVAVVMFCILGGITLLAQIYNLNNIKSRTVGDGQHGTARKYAGHTNKFPSRRSCGGSRQKATHYRHCRRASSSAAGTKAVKRLPLWTTRMFIA
jgi:hypothetical protein